MKQILSANRSQLVQWKQIARLFLTSFLAQQMASGVPDDPRGIPVRVEVSGNVPQHAPHGVSDKRPVRCFSRHVLADCRR
jgi:hypothetical protein